MNPNLLFETPMGGQDYATIDAHQHELSQYASLPSMELAQKYHDALALVAMLTLQNKQLTAELNDAKAMLNEWEINDSTRPAVWDGYE